ncbi:hypothetical protein MTR67_048516 [Solanum verrucosum]|uniref:Uncharacterized protein n=1 Tax=Solanum verrucosum TaxID=315347 RepID=A0AAF0V1G7_SOLVR|nr:hypothetical protein MTR67_048516 [Solanum verrucosum]
MGFGEKWLKWIDFCIKTVKFSVLVNGEPVGCFGSESGLRQASSGLKVNWGKTSLFPIKEVPNIQNLAIILGCKIENMPTTYLGMPLGSDHKAGEIWDGIIEKTEKRLARWKAQYISLGGRLILINFVLDTLPTYVMSLFLIPPKVMKKMDRLRRDFLWHGCKEGKGYKLVNWQTTMHNREQGGLGFRNLRAQNNSLLVKWIWRYNREDHALWREVIRHNFGELNPWCTNMSTDTNGVGVWKTIRALWPKLERNLQKIVGDGKRINSGRSKVH